KPWPCLRIPSRDGQRRRDRRSGGGVVDALERALDARGIRMVGGAGIAHAGDSPNPSLRRGVRGIQARRDRWTATFARLSPTSRRDLYLHVGMLLGRLSVMASR